MPTRSRSFEVKAEIATGTSCRFCSRFSAVTTSSSIVVFAPAAAAVAVGRVCASDGPEIAAAATQPAANTLNL